jgi:phage anti-repressor protein
MQNNSMIPSLTQTSPPLIPLEKRLMGENVVQTINGRDIYDFLEVKKDYSAWVKAQIKRAQMIENKDFITFTQKGERPTGRGATVSIEYFFTLEMGEHIGMMSGTTKGREVRHYFSECRRRLVAKQTSILEQYPELKLIVDTAHALVEVRKYDPMAKARGFLGARWAPHSTGSGPRGHGED